MKIKNFKTLIQHFINGETSGNIGNLTIQNDYLIHFDTVIIERVNQGYILNLTRYSIQTGRFQNQLIEMIPPDKIVKKAIKVPVDYIGSLVDFKSMNNS